MENNKSKSLGRNKRTFFTMAKVLAKEGCAAIVPGGGIAFEAVEALVNHAKQFYKDRTETRLYEFHLHLLGEEITEAEQNEFMEKPISLEDYYSLLSAAIQDDEDNKVMLYANLLRNLSKGNISFENRIHILKVVKAMTFEEAEFIRKFYIYNKYDIMPEKGPSVEASSMFDSKTLKGQIMIQNLKAFGIILEISTGKFKPTQLLNIVVESLYEPDFLKPDSIGEVTWSGINAIIVSYRMDVHHIMAKKLQEILRKFRVKSVIALLNDKNVKTANIFHHAFLFLLDSIEVPQAYKGAITKLKPERVIIKLFLKNSDGTVPLDSLPDLKAGDALPIDISSKEDIKLFEKLIQKYFGQPD
jgi:hypothetical protein